VRDNANGVVFSPTESKSMTLHAATHVQVAWSARVFVKEHKHRLESPSFDGI
jgi:hypothetical protein